MIRSRVCRRRGTDRGGCDFGLGVRDAVWYRTPTAGDEDPRQFRRDALGNLLRYEEFEKRTEHGWEIDHVRPVSRGGTDALENLQALHWRANRDKAEAWPWEAANPQVGLLGRACLWGEAWSDPGAEREGVRSEAS